MIHSGNGLMVAGKRQRRHGYVPTPKQAELRALVKCKTHHFILAEGGSRSGKTFELVNDVFVRACLVPGSIHLIARLRFSHIKRAICYQTMPRLLKARGIPATAVPLNKTDWFYTLPNGSQIWIAGLDEGARLEKVLGNDYSTIYVNEASEVGYEAFDTLLSRLVPAANMRGKFLIDFNPPSKQHWAYKIFHERKFPDGRPVPDDDFVWIKMNPDDNPHLPPEYLKTLEMMSLAKQKRFRYGEYSDDQGSLWKRAFFRYDLDVAKEDLLRVVVAVDPSGTVGGDEIGIIVAAQTGRLDPNGLELFLVLDDYSLHGTPREWAAEVNAAYTKWGADLVVAEKNFGGDMVEDVIKRNHRNMNVKLITSSRGKVVRAEPVSAMYEITPSQLQSRVAHRVPFLTLEDELCNYDPAKSPKSPNRLDALVFALSELSGDGPSIFDVL